MKRMIQKATAGDPVALEAVVEALRPTIAKLASYYAQRSGEDADDLLQEALVALLEAVHVVNIDIGRPEQYLIKRAKWRVLDVIKRSRVRRSAPLDDEPIELEDSGAQNAFQDVLIQEFACQLNATQRAVLEYLLGGHTLREVGKALGCTSANIAYYIRQIRRRYVEWMDEEASAM